MKNEWGIDMEQRTRAFKALKATGLDPVMRRFIDAPVAGQTYHCTTVDGDAAACVWFNADDVEVARKVMPAVAPDGVAYGWAVYPYPSDIS